MHRIRWKDRLDRQIDIIGINWIAQCYPMIQPYPTICNASGTAIHAKRRNVLHLFAQTCPNYFQVTSSQSRKPQELTWIRGPLIGRGSLGRVFKAVEMDGQSNLRRGPWLSYFWGLHWLKDHPIPSMVVFYLKKKSVCSQIDAWTSHRYIVHTKIIPSFIGFISSHHILQ